MRLSVLTAQELRELEWVTTSVLAHIVECDEMVSPDQITFYFTPASGNMIDISVTCFSNARPPKEPLLDNECGNHGFHILKGSSAFDICSIISSRIAAFLLLFKNRKYCLGMFQPLPKDPRDPFCIQIKKRKTE